MFKYRTWKQNNNAPTVAAHFEHFKHTTLFPPCRKSAWNLNKWTGYGDGIIKQEPIHEWLWVGAGIKCVCICVCALVCPKSEYPEQNWINIRATRRYTIKWPFICASSNQLSISEFICHIAYLCDWCLRFLGVFVQSLLEWHTDWLNYHYHESGHIIIYHRP